MLKDGHRCGLRVAWGGGCPGDIRIGKKQTRQTRCTGSSFQTGELVMAQISLTHCLLYPSRIKWYKREKGGDEEAEE